MVVAYAVVAWAIVELIVTIEEPLSLPGWSDTLVIVLAAIGFPVAIVFTWIFDITSEGIVRTKKENNSEPRLDDFDLPAPESAQKRLENSVAVLPFENLSSSAEDAYFTAGVHESILGELARIKGLNVIARTSVLRYDGETTISIPNIARQLNVETVMEGTVRFEEDRVRITAQLIDGIGDTHIWSAKYERERLNIFSIQDDIAAEVATALRTQFGLARESQPLSPGYPTDQSAYEDYLRGRYLWNKRDKRNIKNAIAFFERAIDADPSYCQAYAGIADCFITLGNGGHLRPAQSFPRARRAARRALAICETLPEPHASLANVMASFEWDWAGAESEYRRAIALGPSYATAHQWFGLFLSGMQRFDEALSHIQKALALDPLSPVMGVCNATVLYHARNYLGSVEHCLKVLELEPEFPAAHSLLGNAYLMSGNEKLALESHSRAAQLSHQGAQQLALLGGAYARAGSTKKCKEILLKLDVIEERSYVSPFFRALIHANLGDIDQAFRYLRAAHSDRSDWFQDLRVEPLLDNLRADERFTQLLVDVGLN